MLGGLEVRGRSGRAIPEGSCQVADLPLEDGAVPNSERLPGGITPVVVHDHIVRRCQEPDRDVARDRREDFLDSSP